MNIKNIKGLKYPDEYFIKFFFKYQFHTQKNIKFLEIGCSNGCNLMLPYSYDFDLVGVDLNTTSIEYANENFKQIKKQNYKFHTQDMRDFCSEISAVKADVLVLANSIYYISQNDFIEMLQNIKKNDLIQKNATLFLRFRTPRDFRNKKGEYQDENAYIMHNGITGEDGVFCKFYEEEEMASILQNELNLRDFQSMKIEYENIQNGVKVNNSDIVIWGKIN